EPAAGLEVADGAVDAAGVGEGEGGHLQLRRALGQLDRVGGAVEEREVGVAVELDVRVHPATRPPYLRSPSNAALGGALIPAFALEFGLPAATACSLATQLGDRGL